MDSDHTSPKIQQAPALSANAVPPGVSVVIPTYNSAEILQPLIKRTMSVLDGLDRLFEIIIVDDGSDDSTWSKIAELTNQDARIGGVRLRRNYGQHNALLCGIRRAQFNLVVTMDDASQHPPDAIPELVDALAPDNDVAYGIPLGNPHSCWRTLSSRWFRILLSRLTGVGALRQATAFRAFRTDLRIAFGDFRSSCTSIDALLTWGSTRYAYVPIEFRKSNRERSNYSITKLFRHAGQTIVAFSGRPLQIATCIGLLMIVMGVLLLSTMLVWPATRHWFDIPLPVLMAVNVVFAGGLFTGVGALGLYLGCVLLQVSGPPSYLIRDEVSLRIPSSGKKAFCSSAA